MVNIRQYEQIITELESRVKTLEKAIEIDAANTIMYCAAVDYCNNQINMAKAIIEAEEVVKGASKKDAPKVEHKEENPKKDTKTKSKKKELKQEEPTPKDEEQVDIFDMFGE